MIIMPILDKDKIYNVEIKLKDYFEDQNLGVFEKHYESDLIVNGQNYNDSSYNAKNANLNSLVNFIRNNTIYMRSSYVLTSRRNEQGKMYTYRIPAPPRKVTEGLDCLYGNIIQDMKKSIPQNEKGRILSLKKLGVTDHIMEKDLKLVRKSTESSYITDKNDPRLKEKELYLLFATIEFLDLFDCTVLEDSTMDLKEFQSIQKAFLEFNSEEGRKINKYYHTALENANEYRKIQFLSKIMTGETFYWIKRGESKVKIKSIEDGKWTKNGAD